MYRFILVGSGEGQISRIDHHHYQRNHFHEHLIQWFCFFQNEFVYIQRIKTFLVDGNEAIVFINCVPAVAKC
jgi:hypothetical protein